MAERNVTCWTRWWLKVASAYLAERQDVLHADEAEYEKNNIIG